MANIKVGSTGGRGGIDSANLQSQTRAEAAEKVGVSERSVNTAKKVLDSGNERLITAVDEVVESRKKS